MFLIKKKERVLKISAVKLECSLSDNSKDNENSTYNYKSNYTLPSFKKKVHLNKGKKSNLHRIS